MNFKLDYNLVRRFIANGSPRNLAKIQEEAAQARIHHARTEEIRKICPTMYIVNAQDAAMYAKTGDAEAWQRIIACTTSAYETQREKLERQFHVLERTGHSAPLSYLRRSDIVASYIDTGNGQLNGAVGVACDKALKDLQDHSNPVQFLKELRRSDLVVELCKHNLVLRSDSRFCLQYITGTTDASLQEVVATMKLTSFLFNMGHKCWSENHGYLESQMRNRIKAGMDHCWYDACKVVVQAFADSDWSDWPDSEDGISF